jgi:NSS family neurotransmitter:Na+ symporter
VGELQAHANAVSDIPIGAWWKFSLTFITPLMLGYMLVDNTITNLTSNYEDYPTAFLRTYGWGIVAASIIAGVAFTLKSWNERLVEIPEEARV